MTSKDGGSLEVSQLCLQHYIISARICDKFETVCSVRENNKATNYNTSFINERRFVCYSVTSTTVLHQLSETRNNLYGNLLARLI